MFCTNCGIGLDELDEYCSSCGARTELDESPASPNAYVADSVESVPQHETYTVFPPTQPTQTLTQPTTQPLQQPSQPIMQNSPHPTQTLAQPSLKPRRPTPMRIPLDSKLPLVAGFVAAAGVIFRIFIGWAGVVGNFAILIIGASIAILAFTLAKKNLKLIAIPMFMFLLLLTFNISNFIINGWWRYAGSLFVISTLLSNLVNLALPIVFLLTVSGKINTKIPLIIICVVNLFYGGLFHRNIHLILFDIIFATPYLLLAVAMSKDSNKVYYEKPVYRPPAYASAQMPNRTNSSAVSPLPSLKRFCGACGMEISGINVFCPHCGSSLAEQLASSGQTPNYNAAASYPRAGYADDAPSGG